MRSRRNPVDDAVRRLTDAYRHAGLKPIPPAPSDIDRVLAELHREIAPLRLPEDVERFWRLIDGGAIYPSPTPRPCSADAALSFWKMCRDEGWSASPKLLFPVGIEGWSHLLVELDDGAGAAGALIEGAFANFKYDVRFPSLLSYLDLWATMIESEEFRRHDGDHGPWIEFDPDDRWDDAQAVRLSAAQPLPRLGNAREIQADNPGQWPAHWLAANGFTSEMSTPCGASTTVADLLRGAAAGKSMAGTIRATVTSLGMSGEGRRVDVSDGTGSLDVWCPAAICIYGPVIRKEFEFDVEVRANPSAAPDWASEQREATSRALAGDMEGAASAVRDMHAKAFETGATAEATAIRPLD